MLRYMSNQKAFQILMALGDGKLVRYLGQIF
jgi:hypothetical protein